MSSRRAEVILTVELYDATPEDAVKAFAEYGNTFLTDTGEVEIVDARVKIQDVAAEQLKRATGAPPRTFLGEPQCGNPSCECHDGETPAGWRLSTRPGNNID